MYKKLKNTSNNFADLKAQNYCSDLLKYNSDVLFATSKNFMENANKKEKEDSIISKLFKWH